jgi:hypothetical protein
MKLLKAPYFLLAAYSISITALVSSTISLSLYKWTQNFLDVFYVASVAQFVLFLVYNTYTSRQDRKHAISEYIKQELEYSNRDIKIQTKLICAYCKTPDNVIVNISKNEPYECAFCKQHNSIKIQIIPTQITTPIENVSNKIVDVANNN